MAHLARHLANGRYWAGGPWNRLTTVNNGQGGTITLAYANIGQAVNSPLLDNQRRITTRTLTDGRGNSYAWSYSYGTPSVNYAGQHARPGLALGAMAPMARRPIPTRRCCTITPLSMCYITTATG